MRSTILVLALLIVACTPEPAEPPADTVLTGGRIYTVEPDQPWAEAAAIRDGRYIAVGTSEEIAAYIGEHTDTVDLAGRFAMPGINDLHIHPVWGGVKTLYECQFPFTAGPDQIRSALAACVAAQPEAAWIRGGQWDSSFFEKHDLASPREFLDAISDTHAIYLADDSGHNGWVNSRALALAGIDSDTPDPEGGYIVRDALGAPNGVLLETAIRRLDTVVPEPTDEQYIAAAAKSVQIARGFGITGMKDAGAFRPAGMAFSALDRAGRLTMHIAVCQRTTYGQRQGALDYAALEAERDRHRTDNVHTSFVKLFLDGVPTVARTAAMLAPYTADDAHGEEFDGGAMHLTEAQLTADLVELDRRGFTVKMHVAGDRSVRAALDAIAEARRTNGDSGLRHELAHAGYIDPEDIPRFAELGAVADFSPYLWHPSPIIESVVNAVGQNRGERYWPARDLLDAGAMIVAGSDWPSAVPSANPWMGISALVTRADPRRQTPGTLWPEQAISMAEALHIFTQAGADGLRLGDVTGSVRVGKSADLIVLDRNPFETEPAAVADTAVQVVYFRGQRVSG